MKLRMYYNKYLEHLQLCGLHQKTIAKHRLHLFGSLSHSVQDTDVDDLRLSDVAKVLHAGRLHGKYGEQDAVRVFRSLLKYLEDSGVCLPFNPHKIKSVHVPQKSVEALTREDIEVLRKHMPTDTVPAVRTRALVEVLLSSGMRIAEALSLNRDDIRWHTAEATIVNCKSGEREKVYFSQEALLWLKKYLNMRDDDGEALFVSRRGKRLKQVTSRYALAKYTKDAESIIGKHIHHHLFRATFATLLLNGGLDIKAVQSLTRHKSERTTLRHYIAFQKHKDRERHHKVFESLA